MKKNTGMVEKNKEPERNKKNKKKRMMHAKGGGNSGGGGDGGQQETTTTTTYAPTTTLFFPALPPVSLLVPTDNVTLSRVRVSNFFIAYVAPDATREPTQDEYGQMVNITAVFFKSKVAGVTLLDVVPTLNYTLFQAGIPDARFNIYMEYAYADLTFDTAGGSPPTLPTTDEAFVLLRDTIDATYILDYVRSLVAADSPFVSTNEVFLQSTTMENNPPPINLP